jgi:predicted Rossmann fold nucleotide-binding protein DprA/Smf involved in DNA uptake
MDKNQKIMEQLKTLNQQKPLSKELMDYYKKTNEKMKKVLDSIKTTEKEISEIAKENGIDSKEVLWCLTGLVKYGKAEHIPAKTGYMKYKAK